MMVCIPNMFMYRETMHVCVVHSFAVNWLSRLVFDVFSSVEFLHFRGRVVGTSRDTRQIWHLLSVKFLCDIFCNICSIELFRALL